MNDEQENQKSISLSNTTQVGGNHYRDNRGGGRYQHWDWVYEEGLDYFQGQITKYVARYKKKNGVEDLKKARHFLDKYIELIEKERLDHPIPPQQAESEDWYADVAGQIAKAPGRPRNPY